MQPEMHDHRNGDSKESEDTFDSAPVYVDDSSSDDAVKPSSPSHHHNRRASVVSFSTSANPFIIFRNALPDRSSRLMFLLLFVGVVVGTALWLHWTITVKWIQQQEHPTVMVSLERLEKVPPMNAVGFSFNQIFFDTAWGEAYSNSNGALFNDTLEKTPKNSLGPFISPYFQSGAGACTGCNITDPVEVKCDMIDIRNKSYLCQPSKNGQSLYSNDMNAPLPDLEVEWDWNLRGTGDQLCFYIWQFVDVQSVLKLFGTTSFPYFQPYVEVYLTPSNNVSPFNYWMSIGRDPSMLSTMKADLPASFVYPMNYYHSTSLTVSKYKGLQDQFAQRTYTIANRDSLAVTDEIINRSLDFFTYLFPNDAERVTDFLKNDTVNHKLYFMTYCLRISDMSALSSKEIATYGILPFLSDCGGFLSLLILALSLLFPIVARISEPRKFLPLLLIGRYQHRKEKEQQKAFATMNGITTSNGSEYLDSAVSRRQTHQTLPSSATAATSTVVDDHQVAQPQVQVELSEISPSFSQPMNQQMMTSDANSLDQSQL